LRAKPFSDNKKVNLCGEESLFLSVRDWTCDEESRFAAASSGGEGGGTMMDPVVSEIGETWFRDWPVFWRGLLIVSIRDIAIVLAA
jgi:hypothetical protein